MEELKMRDLVKTKDGGYVIVDTCDIHGFRDEYETAVYESNEDGEVFRYNDELDICKYSCKESAIQGHQEMIEAWGNKDLQDILVHNKTFDYANEVKYYLSLLEDLVNSGKMTIQEVIDYINEDDYPNEERNMFVTYKPGT